MKYIVIIFSLCLLSLTSCKSYTSVRHAPDYKTALAKQPSIVVLPPEVNVYTESFMGQKDRMYDFEYYLEPRIQEAIYNKLKEKGYRAIKLTKRDLKESNLYQDVHALRNKYVDTTKKLYVVQAMQEEHAFNIENSVGDAARTLMEKTGQKVFVLSDYEEVVEGNGARLRDFAIDVLVGSRASSVAENSTLTLGFVDAQTGKVLWTNQNLLQTSTFDFDALYKSDEELAQGKIDSLTKYSLGALPDKSELGGNITSIAKEQITEEFYASASSKQLDYGTENITKPFAASVEVHEAETPSSIIEPQPATMTQEAEKVETTEPEAYYFDAEHNEWVPWQGQK